MTKILKYLDRPHLWLAIVCLFFVTAAANGDYIKDLTKIQREGNAWLAAIENHNQPYKLIRRGGSGDCDNYAAIKMLMVRASMPHAEAFYLEGYVRPNGDPKRDYHSVLVVWIGKKWYVLDNLSRDVMVTKPGKTYLKNTAIVKTVYSQEIAKKILKRLDISEFN